MAEIVDFGLQQHKIKMDSRYFENVLSVVAGDTGRRIEVQLLDTNGMVQNTTGLNLRLNALVAGKATFTDATLVDATTGKYRLDLSNGMFLAPGNWQFQWQITDSAGKKLHSFAFTGNIGKNISEGGSQATNFYLNLEDLKKMQDDLINGTIDSSILETTITEKLTDLETQYAPKLTEVTAQLADKATKTALGIEKARIDTFTTLPSGSTTGDAELIDGHIGADGVTYPNIGTAIRKQIENLTNKSLIMPNERVMNDTHIYYDANNVPKGTIIGYGGSGLNVPITTGTLMTFEGTSANGLTQIYIAHTGIIFTRMRWGGVWTVWQTYKTTKAELAQFKALLPYGRTNTSSDCNTLEVNSVYIVLTAIPNLPEGEKGGTIITMGGETVASASGVMQFFISSAIPTKIYTRLNWANAWRDWIPLNNESNESNGNSETIESRDFYGTFSLFEEIGVIGDSYASGASGEKPTDTSSVDHMNISWPQVLARRNGVNVTNYTKGGLSTRSFLTNTDIGMSKLESDPIRGLYLLALIRNDYNTILNGETDYLGSIADITDNSLGSYPDTFYGNYATIIERIQLHAADSPIVMMTGLYALSNTIATSFNTAMAEIANHYNIPIMTQLDEPYFSDPFYRTGWPAGAHPSGIIYGGMAMAIERMFNKCVYDYKDYFNYYHG